MPLHDEENIERVMNIVSPTDINFVYRDYGYGEILEEEAYDFERYNLDDDIFVVENMFHEECDPDEVVADEKINENNGFADELCIKRTNEDGVSYGFHEFDDTERTISELSSSRTMFELDTDAVSSSGSSCMTASTSYTRREIPERMQSTLRRQLALFLKESESNLVRDDNKTSISKLKVRKRALEKSCHQPNFFHSLRLTSVN